MKAPLPAALNEVSLTAVGGKIHVIGGSVLGFTGPYHLEYDPAADKWSARAPLPNRLDHIGSAVLNGKIYTVGGFVGGGTHKDGQDVAYEYDPATDTWRVLAPLKAGRGSIGVAALDGKLHAIGGRLPTGKTVATHDVYDPATNKWSEAAPLPKARDHVAIGVVDGKIHVAGGRFGASSDRTDMHDVYDPKTQYLDGGPAAADATQRLGRHGLQRLVHGARWRNAARPTPTPRTKPTTPRPIAGERWRRCRQDVTPPAPPPTANTSISPVAP